LRTSKLRYDAILCDLLTALLDSWTVWDRVAGSVDAGRRWRSAYLRLTYGCGAYRPYETLVAEAAVTAGLPATAAEALDAAWRGLTPWPGVRDSLDAVRTAGLQIGVVTNCSERLGHIAAGRVGVPFDVVTTSERAGYYKPDERPYRLALAELGLAPDRVLFIAGSAFDLVGTARVGLPTVWHNRIGLARPPEAPPPLDEGADFATLVRRALGEPGG
jgi:2-haloalkanoic acid dehalogenase type II